MKFEIIIPVYNAASFVDRCIQSCLNQASKADVIRVLDAKSEDGTYEKLLSYGSQISLTRNKIRRYPLENTIELVNCCDDDSVCIMVDGDDFLADENVVGKIKEIYNTKDIWMTYGGYVEYPFRDVRGCYRNFTEEEILNRTYRKTGWASHLKTFKKKLFKKINDIDFRDQNGNYFDMAGDCSYIYPMLEMSGFKKCYTDDILYVYNKTNPISDQYIDNNKLDTIADYIKSKPPYQILENI